MSFALLWPTGLLALGALLLPLLIHLSKQLQRTRTEFAALQWVSATVRPRRRWRLRRWWLLLLRLLLLSVAALLLAQPVQQQTQALPTWVAVMPDIAPSAVVALRSTLKDANWVELQPGFPPWRERGDAAATTSTAQSSASLLRELDLRLPVGTPLVVLAPQRWSGLDGERLALSRIVDWRVLDNAPVAGSDAVESQTKSVARPPLLYVHSDADGAPQLRVLAAVIAGWNAQRRPPQAPIERLQLDLAGPLPATDGLLVWLSAEPLPERLWRWIEGGGTLLLDVSSTVPQNVYRLPLQRAPDGELLVWAQRIGGGRVVQTSRALSLTDWPELAEAEFAQRLLGWLYPTSAAAPSIADAQALRAQQDTRLRPAPAVHSLSSWLALLLALLFVLERGCASWSRRPAP
jgi:hypothetical protein